MRCFNDMPDTASWLLLGPAISDPSAEKHVMSECSCKTVHVDVFSIGVVLSFDMHCFGACKGPSPHAAKH